MNLRSLHIEGYKSLKDIHLSNPNRFSVFVGPNGSGKSNIFEAIEMFQSFNKRDFNDVIRLYGGTNDIVPKSQSNETCSINFSFELLDLTPSVKLNFKNTNNTFELDSAVIGTYSEFFYSQLRESNKIQAFNFIENSEYRNFVNFSRLFIGKSDLLKDRATDDSKLNLDGSNLEKVLGRILRNSETMIELADVLSLFVPGLVRVEIKKDELTGSETLLFYENSVSNPLQRHLISDGTINIICLLAAVYQSDKPQFLLIEEPENGLNPKVVRELVKLVRLICEEKGHYIWFTSHSQSILSELNQDEVIIVDKKDGVTDILQAKNFDLKGLSVEDALMANVFGKGVPW